MELNALRSNRDQASILDWVEALEPRLDSAEIECLRFMAQDNAKGAQKRPRIDNQRRLNSRGRGKCGRFDYIKLGGLYV